MNGMALLVYINLSPGVREKGEGREQKHYNLLSVLLKSLVYGW